MKFKGTKLSNRTVALFAAAILLLSTGGFMGVKAAPQIQGSDYDAALNLDSIGVQLYENGTQIKNGGTLLEKFKNEKVTPGKVYDEKITIENTGTASEYVRLIVRKYWKNADGKATSLDTDLIGLTMASDDWVLNESESTSIPAAEGKPAGEMSVYYYTDQLGSRDTVPAISAISIDREIANAVTTKEKSSTDADGNKTTTITYYYEYDGYTFNIEVEAQAVQTHNANDAIKSIWGVSDVTESGNRLSVK